MLLRPAEPIRGFRPWALVQPQPEWWQAATQCPPPCFRLAQLENGRTGVIAKVPLRQRPKLHQLWVVLTQEPEIARWHHGSPTGVGYLLRLATGQQDTCGFSRVGLGGLRL